MIRRGGKQFAGTAGVKNLLALSLAAIGYKTARSLVTETAAIRSGAVTYLLPIFRPQ